MKSLNGGAVEGKKYKVECK